MPRPRIGQTASTRPLRITAILYQSGETPLYRSGVKGDSNGSKKWYPWAVHDTTPPPALVGVAGLGSSSSSCTPTKSLKRSTTESMRLDGKVALISGAARGQGAAEARLFAREGASVVLGDVLEHEGKTVEAAIKGLGGRALFLKLDVTRGEDWERAVGAAVRSFGRLDILVNNAAILRTEAVEETSEELWEEVMGVNALGVFLGTKHVVPEMRRVGGGSIINIASTSAITASAVASAYHASKGAVRSFTRAAAMQYAAENIRVNSVYPGGVDTLMVTEAYDPSYLDDRMGHVPMRRRGRPEEIAYGVLYLASDESSFVTGSELVIDGGSTAQ